MPGVRVRGKKESVLLIQLDFTDEDFLKFAACIFRRRVAFRQISPAAQFIRDGNNHGFRIIKAQERSEHSFQGSTQTKLGFRFSSGPCNQQPLCFVAFIGISQITSNTLMINPYADRMMRLFKS